MCSKKVDMLKVNELYKKNRFLFKFRLGRIGRISPNRMNNLEFRIQLTSRLELNQP